MRLKYYKEKLHNLIKDSYFKNFNHLGLKNDFIKGNFQIYHVNRIKSDGNSSVHKELIRMLRDFDGVEMDVYAAESIFMKNIKAKLEVADELINKVFNGMNFPLAIEVADILSNLSTESYLVGGGPRDILMGKDIHDFDFVTDASYDIITKAFKSSGFDVVEKGKEFLVLKIKKDGQEFDISNFRKDGTYTDGRRPDSVSIGTILDDAERRDFTCNALFFNISSFTTVDPTGDSILDIYDMILRFIGNPKDRLNADLLRVYRFYRFLGKGFSAEKNSLTAVRRSFKCANETVAAERIKIELEKMVNVE